MNTPQGGDSARIALTVGPVPYFWGRQALTDFYAEVADSAADSVVLGETVCSRRREFKTDDWLALARELAAAGKEVVLATLSLVESEADLKRLRRIAEQGDFLVEAGDVSAINVLSGSGARYVLGPHINVYSRATLDEYRRLGAARWVPPLELSLADLAHINAGGATLATEVFGYGRMPLAFSARCFTARHHGLTKDQCEFRCRDDADGLLLKTTDGRPFLVLNGIQTQSAARACLLAEREALLAAGASRVRLSPTSRGFALAIAHFDAVLNRGQDPADALRALADPALAGPLADGYAHGRAGIDWSHA
ncbi:U32 family peptidase [Rubrivivax sp. A210]|uniref:U32 family peptidase n=1 Tax=Rubrivivax sp. A210 TaxID=2772301 RepID=UPI001919175C|nr:U32 family peptidase [Rubrivivax sp. A210]CAD5373100.1 U32 family peptidase [Rubrivivax sp. A210]